MKASIPSTNVRFNLLESSVETSVSVQKKGFSQLWEFALNLLGNGETFRIHEKCDRHGNAYWEVYDAIAEERIVLSSEAEVRVWIEQRYSR